MKTKVTVWNENRHESMTWNEELARTIPAEHHEAYKKLIRTLAEIYPKGIHGMIAGFLAQDPEIEVRTATLDEPEHGLTDDVLENTDVLIWWGHVAHAEVRDDIAAKVHERVLKGMGLILLHSSHHSKIFKRLMGTTCDLGDCREIAEKERVWVIEPSHPIAEGLGDYFDIEHEEMYGERFDIPAPDTLVFVGWFGGGEVFRSGCCYTRGRGRIFYFQPGHESYPVYHNENVQRVIKNAVKWVRR